MHPGIILKERPLINKYFNLGDIEEVDCTVRVMFLHIYMYISS